MVFLMSNNLFYYFSTVAQSMASIIAFLGVFVVFRIQYLDNIMNTIHRAIDEHATNRLNEQFVGEINLFKKVRKIIENKKNDTQYNVAISEIEELITRYNELQMEKQSISKYFKWPTICSLIVIISSFFGILCINSKTSISCQNNLLYAIFGINVIFIILSIIKILHLLILSLKSEIISKKQ